MMFSNMLAEFGHSCCTARSHNESVDLTVLTTESDFIMRHGAVVIDTVSLVEYLCM